MTPAFVIGNWSFDFGKQIAKSATMGETRFRISKGRVVFYNGRWWERWASHNTKWDGVSEREILEAYEHWQFERIVLT